MQSTTGRLLPGFAAVLVVVAVLGFLLGDHGGSGASSRPRIAAGAGTLVEYPASWRPVSGAASIPGLALHDRLLLAPGGRAKDAGLLSGRLSAKQSDPLPRSFVNHLQGLPRIEVVTLTDAEAYRYRKVRLQGYDRALELYVVPTSVEGPIALGCYAARESSAFIAQCEQIVAQIALPGQAPYALNPDGAYSAQLAKLLGGLDRQRLSLRREMSANVAPSEAASLAASLAERFAATAAAVRQLEAPQAASSAQAALANSLQDARAAYQAFAEALEIGSSIETQAAQEGVASAEAEVNAALEGYALLGYSRV